jgi:hypothetical protein
MNPPVSKWQFFKQEINLIDFACANGYVINKKKSTRHSVCLAKGNEDKIIVSRKNGIWVYFSVYDSTDNGTIIDFVQNKLQKSYMAIFEMLENWQGTSSSKSYAVPETPVYNQNRVQKLFENCKPIEQHLYLSKRGIDKELLVSERFANTIYSDNFNNVVFPQYKDEAVSALELKNKQLHVFAKGSEKTVWQSNRFKTDTHLYIAETPIDALSYQALFSLSNAFYIATSGSPSKSQLDYIRNIIPDFEQTVCIVDNDTGGDRIFDRIEKMIGESEIGCRLNRHSPKKVNDDWNDVLQTKLI